MLVKFFDQGHAVKHNCLGGNGARNYLLSEDRVANGTAILMRGDPKATTEVINSIRGNGQLYTSGCLAFDYHEHHKLNESQKHAIMDSFEQALFPGLQANQYSGYWVQHTDKTDEQGNHRLELNFVYANLELTHGRALTVYLSAIDNKRIDAWKDITNHEYDLSNPNSPQRQQLHRIDYKQPRSNRELQQDITKYLVQLVAIGSITNHQDVLDELKANGLEVVSLKRNRDQINIKNPYRGADAPSIPLKGALYERSFTAQRIIQQIRAESTATNNEKTRIRESEIERIRRIYDTELAKRETRLIHRYGATGQTQTGIEKQPELYADSQRTATTYLFTERTSDNPDGRIQQPVEQHPQIRLSDVTKQPDAIGPTKPVITTTQRDQPNQRNNPQRTTTDRAFKRSDAEPTEYSSQASLVFSRLDSNINPIQQLRSLYGIPYVNPKPFNAVSGRTSLDDNNHVSKRIHPRKQSLINLEQQYEQATATSSLDHPEVNHRSPIVRTVRAVIQQFTTHLYRPLQHLAKRFQGFIKQRKEANRTISRTKLSVELTERAVDEVIDTADAITKITAASVRRATEQNRQLDTSSEQAESNYRAISARVKAQDEAKQRLAQQQQQEQQRLEEERLRDQRQQAMQQQALLDRELALQEMEAALAQQANFQQVLAKRQAIAQKTHSSQPLKIVDPKADKQIKTSELLKDSEVSAETSKSDEPDNDYSGPGF